MISPETQLSASLTAAVRPEQHADVGHHLATIRPRRRLRPAVVAGVLGAVTAVVTTGLVVELGGPWSPEEAVLDFTDAMADQDFKEGWELLCREQQERYDSSIGTFTIANVRPPGEGSRLGGVEIVDESRWDESRGAHVVSVRSTWPAEQRNAQLLVVEEDGDYRVCGAVTG